MKSFQPAAGRGAARSRRALLSAGVSLSAMSAGIAAAAPPPLSPAWFAARVDRSGGSGSVATPSTTLSQVTTATRTLANLAARLAQLQGAQAAAVASAAAAAAGSAVPNGLVFGGLQTAPGAVPGGPSWVGANLPTQVANAGRATVGVKQTAPQAFLTWQSFNVGSKTTLAFDTSAGGANAANWVTLNRIADPYASPSEILGSITSPGKVYLINPNGIIFGAGSQINVNALIASTADISNAQLTAAGIYGAQVPGTSTFAPSFTGAANGSQVLVEQGARITTPAPASTASGGGSVLLLGGAVENDGAIATPSGQTILAAGSNFTLRTGYGTTGNQGATVQGSQIATDGRGTVTNTGLISATHGDITLAGHAITQAGVVLSTTSVTVRGTVHLLNATTDGNGSITLAPGSITTVNPDNGTTTALDSQRSQLIAQSAANNVTRALPASALNPLLNDVSLLPDRLDESRVEIVTGGDVAMDPGSLILSQGGQIAVQAAGRTWIGQGAQLDVSGATAAVLPASSNTISLSIQGNELRDAPVNRDAGLLASNTVAVDIATLQQITGSDGITRDYTPGGLLEVSGYLGNVGHTIDEWAAPGGAITLAAATVIAQSQATLNVAGGAVSVQAGQLAQSYLTDASGRLYNVNTAPANIVYTGVYGGVVDSHPRWGVTDEYASSLVAPASIAQAGYSYGRDGGSVTVNAPTAVIDAAIQGGVLNGVNQDAARAGGVTDPYAFSQTTAALTGRLSVGGQYLTTAPVAKPGDTPSYTVGQPVQTTVVIGDGAATLADGIAATGVLPQGVNQTTQLDAAQLDAEALGGLTVLTGRTIQVAAPVAVANGGTISLAGAGVTVAAGLTAHGGVVTLTDENTNAGKPAAISTSPRAGGIVVAPGVAIDVSGVFTNLPLAPAVTAGLPYVNGGSVSAVSAQGLTIGAGGVIDASAGAALLLGEKTRGGTGGNVTLTSNDPALLSALPARPFATVLDGSVRDYGVNGGGTLAITAPSIAIGTPAIAAAAVKTAADPVQLAAGLFMTGFRSYVVNGYAGLAVLPATDIAVVEPVYVFYDGTGSLPVNVPTGTLPDAALQLIVPPVYVSNRTTARLTQRQGASIELIADTRPGQQAQLVGGDVTLEAGAAIAVDPGQTVRIEAVGQITDDAAITARGGTVAIVNEQVNQLASLGHATPAQIVNQAESLSIFIGGDATIDVAGLATTDTDTSGREFGTVLAGGTIRLGSDAGTDSHGQPASTQAAILIRPGAVLDASGASAAIDLLAGTTPVLGAQAGGEQAGGDSDPIVYATAGGTIALSSTSGIDLGGTLLAGGGGAGAAGGTLAMVLATPIYSLPGNGAGADAGVPDQLRVARTFALSQSDPSLLASAKLLPGQRLAQSAFGQAELSQAQVDRGGFTTLSLYGDAFVFQGDVALHTTGAIALRQGVIADSARDATVSIAAPDVQLTGYVAPTNADGQIVPGLHAKLFQPFAGNTQSTLLVDAQLIDVAGVLNFGITASLPLVAVGTTVPVRTVALPGFADVTLASEGDIRFGTGTLTTPGNLVLQADQIYPTTQANAVVFAGFDLTHVRGGDLYQPDGSITILSNGGATPAVPYSVAGRLALNAGRIVQDGILRAPLGSITLGGISALPPGTPNALADNPAYTDTVTLLPGSITSVSMDGATIPFGGTVDGVNYSYNGAAFTGSFNPTVAINAQHQIVQAGATLDLAGGGALAGAGFITGRGGSLNDLTNALPVFDAATGTFAAPTLAQAPVYAIVAGYGASYAPTSPVEASGSYGASPVTIGSQITIGAGVPGIAAGTYTLLPAYYALLPGGARVQINTGTRNLVPGVTALGAGAYALNAVTSVANTGVQSALPVGITLTTQAGVLAASQFDTEDYASFAIAQAARFENLRPQLPGDGGTLALQFPAQTTRAQALAYAGEADFTAQAGYRPGQATVGAQKLEITADGATPTVQFTSIAASQLDALGASRLVIGGSLNPNGNVLQVATVADQLAIRSGAVLAAPEIFLVTGASPVLGLKNTTPAGISVADGAVLTTIGQSAPPIDSTGGVYYNTQGSTLVALSNGLLTFTAANGSGQSGPITIDAGASLLTAGTLNFSTSQALTLDPAADYGARYLTLAVQTINIASDAALAQQAAGTLVLPSGLLLTQSVLGRLLAGDPATGAPALQALTLTATGSIDFAGNVALDTIDPATGVSSLQQLVLNTPAIYGVGGPADTATITTNALYWNGIAAPTGTVSGSPRAAASAAPAGVVTNGPGTGTGTLDVVARNIVLGYAPQTVPNDQLTLDRLIEGFATVDLQASGSIAGNNRGTLSVYQAAAGYGQPGTGGTLNLVTPLLTGAAGSVLGITAGGDITLAAAGAASTASTGALGAEIDLAAAAIAVNSTVLLNEGRLTLTATGTATDAGAGSVAIGAAGRIDLAGVATRLVDQTVYGPGGALVIASTAGGISTDAASVIDLSSVGAAAGSLQATAMAGTADLAGTIAGATGSVASAASVNLRASTIGDFAGLNDRLTAGGVDGGRFFEQGQGDLTVAGQVVGHAVTIAVDAGSLTVTGTIDAHGAAPGSINLSAGQDLTIGTTALLDAHGTVLQADSTGAAIAAENRATVSLATTGGTLHLLGGGIDVSSADPVPLGTVDLYAPRTVAADVETGDIAIDAAAPQSITGAAAIALYGVRTYHPTDANGTIEQSHGGPAGSLSLDRINANNAAFIDLADASAAVAGKTAGLARYAGYQIRPEDVIESSGFSHGNLTVTGDLDLHTMRYGAGASDTTGAGVVGLLTLRAANVLTVNGSITDGFATPADAATHTPDDNGWRLYSREPLGQAVTLPNSLPQPVRLANGTTFLTDNPAPLGFGIAIAAAPLRAGVAIPAPFVSATSLVVPPGGFTATATITAPDHSVIAAAGTVIPAGRVIPTGSSFAAGTVLPAPVTVADGTVWPGSASLGVFSSTLVRLDNLDGRNVRLTGGEVIPSGASLRFAGGGKYVELRAKDRGVQGDIYAIANLLAPGMQSWSINLVAGANLASSNILQVLPTSTLAGKPGSAADPAGSIVLADTHYTVQPFSKGATGINSVSQRNYSSFSVIRTGTGDLNLVAGGNVDEASLYGIYTAGMQTEVAAASQAGRATARNGTILGSTASNGLAAYDAVIEGQQQNYPDAGGNVLVAAQGQVLGDVIDHVDAGPTAAPSDNVGDWLWRQGGAGLDQSTSWWINFGSYVNPLTAGEAVQGGGIALTGFTGIGALGGGNVTVVAGGDAGQVAFQGPTPSVARLDAFSAPASSRALVIAIASTGRVDDSSGSPVVSLTGGGALTLDVAGSLNPALNQEALTGLGGALTDLRGDIAVAAGQVGRIDLTFGVPDVAVDPRQVDPFTAAAYKASNGIQLVPGDGTVAVQAMRDLVVDGAGDATRTVEQAVTVVALHADGQVNNGIGGATGFSLWTDATAIDLASSGGNVTPIAAELSVSADQVENDRPTDRRFIYPASLTATAASGSLYYGNEANTNLNLAGESLELAPSPIGQLNLLAYQSIYANGYTVDMSGAAPDLPTALNPAYALASTTINALGSRQQAITNVNDTFTPGVQVDTSSLFAFEADTASSNIHANDPVPAHIYAATGDLLGVQFGEVLNYDASALTPISTLYIAAKPGWLVAGRDIIGSGTRPSAYDGAAFATYPNSASLGNGEYTTGNLLLNNDANSISMLSAGRDILSTYVYVAGPGLLQVSAGRNIDQTGGAPLAFGVFKSIGPVVNATAADRGTGAAISVLAGAAGLDYTAFEKLYLDDANAADLALPLSDPANDGKVQQTYGAALLAWLQQTQGYTGTAADALGAFKALPAGLQGIFVRQVFYEELTASGRQQSDPDSLFYRSYARGREAIATLFPAARGDGTPISYDGAITMDSGTVGSGAGVVLNPATNAPATFDSGISTLNGGAIQVLSPGGGDVLGITGGPVPGASSGLITYGSGDIDIYALGSVLLGQSRVFTTFGGNILIWSAEGDINAGRGAKTTVVSVPPSISYDALGDVTLTPTAPTSGAGIATLAPIAGIVAGDVDLVAPQGTVDAGEAGIRVSGNLNIAALTVLNAANIQTQGKTTGSTATVAVNAAAAQSAAAVAGSSVNAASNTTATRAAQQSLQQPAIITVEIIGATNDDQQLRRRRKPAA